jgi:uncharacterized membrane protein
MIGQLAGVFILILIVVGVWKSIQSLVKKVKS